MFILKSNTFIIKNLDKKNIEKILNNPSTQIEIKMLMGNFLIVFLLFFQVYNPPLFFVYCINDFSCSIFR